MDQRLINRTIILLICISIYFLFIHPFIYFDHLGFFNLKQLVFFLIFGVCTTVTIFRIETKKLNKIISSLLLLILLISYIFIHDNVYENMLWKERIGRFNDLKE